MRAMAEANRQRAEDTRQRNRDRADAESARQREMASHRRSGDVWNIFGDSRLGEGERASSVTAVFGSAVNKGDVAETVVAVFGSATNEGEVGEGVVSVFGNNRVTGRVRNEVVAVFGSVTVNSHVRSVVAVFGDVELGPEAVVDEEVVCVFGTVTRSPTAIVGHHVKNVGGNFGFGKGFGVWVSQCLVKGRPLAFHQGLGWAWIVAGSFLAFYIFLALLFRRGVEKCTLTLETQPGFSALTALATIILTPIVIVLLCITVVGVAVVPFLAGALFFGGLFGKAVMLAWIGRRVTRGFGDGPLGHPAFAVLVGGLIVLLLYTVPVLGFVTYKLLGWLGLGVVVYVVLISLRRENVVAVPAAVAAMGVTAPMSTPFYSSVPLAGATATDPSGIPLGTPPVISAVTMPRAGFWIRLGGLFLDLLILGVLALFMTGYGELMIFGIAAYAAVMWKLKGTTIGGVVCGLKVVRLDGRPLDWATSIVRALACFLSLVVAGLGFIWVAIDDDKQSWHDKIAGTTVVRVPKGVSLL